ncbi:hypothetical protein VP01_99g4 [Puccinia sorghi]|uniref:Uncharacterized protein n=1 Tax=Puccinia sorghi TaxID=27349 RepID=A0A0L6U764_9BASI|nr:hypothetical protein VP01_99g4 [Puccinia sorghi]
MIVGTHAFKLLIDCTDSCLLIFIGQSKICGYGLGVDFLVLVFPACTWTIFRLVASKSNYCFSTFIFHPTLHQSSDSSSLNNLKIKHSFYLPCFSVLFFILNDHMEDLLLKNRNYFPLNLVNTLILDDTLSLPLQSPSELLFIINPFTTLHIKRMKNENTRMIRESEKIAYQSETQYELRKMISEISVFNSHQVDEESRQICLIKQRERGKFRMGPFLPVAKGFSRKEILGWFQSGIMDARLVDEVRIQAYGCMYSSIFHIVFLLLRKTGDDSSCTGAKLATGVVVQLRPGLVEVSTKIFIVENWQCRWCKGFRWQEHSSNLTVFSGHLSPGPINKHLSLMSLVIWCIDWSWCFPLHFFLTQQSCCQNQRQHLHIALLGTKGLFGSDLILFRNFQHLYVDELMKKHYISLSMQQKLRGGTRKKSKEPPWGFLNTCTPYPICIPPVCQLVSKFLSILIYYPPTQSNLKSPNKRAKSLPNIEGLV